MKLILNQQVQYKEFVEDVGNRALNEADLDKEGLQRLLTRKEEFQAYISAGIRQFSSVASSSGFSRTPGLFWQPMPQQDWRVQEDYS